MANAQRKENVTTVNELQLAWLAGIADGEGSFYLTVTTSHGFDVVKMSFAVGNTNYKIIGRVKELFGALTGHEIRPCPVKGRGNRKRSWVIQITAQEDMQNLCEAILPYLVGKREQCLLMMEYLSLGSGRRGGSKDLVLFEKRKELASKMKHLNRYRSGAQENSDEASSSARDLTASSHWDEGKVRTATQVAEATQLAQATIQ